MTDTPVKNEQGAKGRLFWEAKASGYPLPFEERSLSRTMGVINFLTAKGVAAEGARVLDIGSGTGAFALLFAERKASVTALDISDNMLKRLTGEAKRLHLNHVRPLRCSWKEIEVGEAGLEDAFDIVLTAFSTAVDTEEDLLAMERCSTRWCIYIASGKIRRTALCEEILRACAAPLDPNPDIRKVRRKLAKMGRAFFFKSFTHGIREERSLKEIAEQVVNRLEAGGGKPDPDFIFAMVSNLCAARTGEGKSMKCHGSVDIGVLVWRVDGKPF